MRPLKSPKHLILATDTTKGSIFVNDKQYRCTVDVNGARAIISRYMLPVELEKAGIINAFARTLAQDIVTETAVPAHNLAATAGYAVIASDTSNATRESPKSLSVLSASSPATKRLESGTTMHVNEGDLLPDGANAIVATADSYRPDQGPEVLVFVETESGANVISAGSRSPAGVVNVKQGTAIGAVEMGIIASLGIHGVPVRRKPKIAVITTGAKVVDIVEKIKPGEARNAARYALVGMLLNSGCDLGRLIHVHSGRPGLERALTACSGCDAIIVAVGSADKHDIALDALTNLGARGFDRVQIEPGGICAFGIVCDTPVFITQAEYTLEAFEAVIRPGLMMLLGREVLDRPRIKASLDSTLKLNPGYAHFLRAHIDLKSGQNIAKPLPTHSADVNSLIVIEQNKELIKRGENVEAIILIN